MLTFIVFLTIYCNDVQITQEYLTQLEDTVREQKDKGCELYYTNKIDGIVIDNIRKICNKNLILLLQCNNIYNQLNECQTNDQMSQTKHDLMHLIYMIKQNINKVDTLLKFKNLKLYRF